jgi:hypothetical protein
MTFQPGQSGNPGGRRRKSDDDRKVEELARAYGVEAIKTLAYNHAVGKGPGLRSIGCRSGRGFGRPLQSIRHGGESSLVTSSTSPAKSLEQLRQLRPIGLRAGHLLAVDLRAAGSVKLGVLGRQGLTVRRNPRIAVGRHFSPQL